VDLIVEWIKRLLIPGSVSFLLLGFAVGVILILRQKWTVWGRRWLTALLLIYWLLSTPACASLLEDAVNGDYTPLAASDLEGVEAIVVLGGGTLTYQAHGYEYGRMGRTTTLRVLEGARLYFLGDEPLVIVSGGSDEGGGKAQAESEIMAEVMASLGVPDQQILQDPTSANTLEEAINIADMMDDLGITRFVLVTSPTHMPRSMGVFQARGMDPIPAIALQHSETLPLSSSLIPNENALEASQGVFREIMATAYYWLRGWFTPLQP
jgi:uncharacterized SAM-binding protein YcdF (DUF218 family)